MIIIRHRSGPLAGTEKRLDGGAGRIVFGRYDDCDVVYPPDVTVVARRHFAIVRKPSGHWTLDLFGTPFVAVDGAPAEPGQPIESGALIELGRRGGPSFEIEFAPESRADIMPLTEVQEQVQLPGAVARSAMLTALLARKWAVYGGAAAIIAVAGLVILTYFIQGETERVNNAILDMVQAQSRTDSDKFTRAVRDRLARSAFLVLVRDSQKRDLGEATAWPVAKNILVTNAHVAQLREKLPAGAKLVVQAPGPQGKSYEVTGQLIHPGYEQFFAAVQRSPPMLIEFGGNAEQVSMVKGYDVALLRVSEDLPSDTILKMADAKELAALKAGDPVAYAGYPQEQILGSEAQPYGATPELHVGNITSITDFFMLPPEPLQRMLIHHNLPATGGSSGSPIIAPSGHVVGVLNAGNLFVIPGEDKPIRVPSAALINYGQSVELVRALLDGKADSELAADRHYWGKQVARLSRGFEALLASVLEGQRPSPAMAPTLAAETTVTLTADSQLHDLTDSANAPMLRGQRHTFKLQAGSSHTFVAFATQPIGIGLYLFVNGKFVARSVGGNYPAISYQAPQDSTIAVVVIGPGRTVTYKLRDYVWQTKAPGS
jgi:hypothetical protein